MKRAGVYLRSKTIFVRTQSHDTSGAWLENGLCTTLPSTVDAETLGAAVYRHLSQSATGVNFPDWKILKEPLLQAAGVKTWSQFAKSARAVAVEHLDDGALTVEGTKNGKEGFGSIEGGLTRLEGHAEPRVLGEAVKAALAASS